MKSLAKYPKCFNIEECVDDQIVYIAETSDFGKKMIYQIKKNSVLSGSENYFSPVILQDRNIFFVKFSHYNIHNMPL